MVKDTNLGRVEAKFNEDLVNYANLIGLSKIELIEELFNKEVEGKVLTNDFIDIDNVYYFDFIELQKNKKITATKKPDSTALSSTVIVKKIPNNLDVPEKELRTYCYNKNPEEHLGLYSYNKIVLNEIKVKDSQLFQYYLLFKYNSGTEELIVELTSIEDVFLMLDIDKAEKVISELIEFSKEFEEAIERVKKAPEEATFKDVITFDNNYINLGTYLTSMLVIEPLTHAKNWSYNILKENEETYKSIIGNKDSDLILIKDIVEDKEKNTVSFITVGNDKGGFKNE